MRCQIAAGFMLGLVVASVHAQQVAVQTTCPSSKNFDDLAAASATVSVASMDSFWAAADRALRICGAYMFFVRGAVRRRNSVLSEVSSAQSAEQRAASSPSRRTCFFERRVGTRDSRIAFRLDASRDRSNSVKLTLYPLSQTKGAVQRTWSYNPTGADVLASQFIDQIRAQLRPSARR